MRVEGEWRLSKRSESNHTTTHNDRHENRLREEVRPCRLLERRMMCKNTKQTCARSIVQRFTSAGVIADLSSSLAAFAAPSRGHKASGGRSEGFSSEALQKSIRGGAEHRPQTRGGGQLDPQSPTELGVFDKPWRLRARPPLKPVPSIVGRGRPTALGTVFPARNNSGGNISYRTFFVKKKGTG